VGQWEDHLPYNRVTQILETPGGIYCVSGPGLFFYSPADGELQRYSKVNGLSDVGVSQIGYHEGSKTLIIAYSNGNVDLMSSAGVTNLPDILNSSVVGDKNINKISVEGDKAWLSCGFGIVVLDVDRIEVSDSYFIAPGGGNIRVNDLLLESDRILAATESGVLKADRTDNLSDFGSWEPLIGFPANDTEVDRLIAFSGKILAHINTGPERVLSFDGVAWTLVAGTQDVDTRDLIVMGNQLLIINRSFAQIRDSELNNLQSISAPSFTEVYQYHTGLLQANGKVWLGEEEYGLIAFTEDEDRSIHPDGPRNEKAWQIGASKGQLWITPGEIKSNGDNLYNNDAASFLINGKWQNLKGRPELLNVRDQVEVMTDPFDPNITYIGTWFGGLLKYNSSNENLTLYNESLGNSPISENLINPGRFQVGGFDFDLSGNLWLSNSNAAEPVKVFQRNGQWNSYSLSPELSPGTFIGQTIHTDEGAVWMVLPRGSGIMVYDYRGTISTLSDDRKKRLSTAENEGGLPTNDVYSIAKDLDGEIWIGTSEGPAVHFSPSGIFNADPIDFQQILIEQDGVVEVLLGNQTITSIAVDGANRKWMGTLSDGVFLLSADGSQQIKRFTKANSPLFSNQIKDIAIDPVSGTVYFATSRGVLGYSSDATGGLIENLCYDVYPNPVRPQYVGPITIDGLMRNSRVTITDVAGNLVYQSLSNGGRVVWDGNDLQGKRVSTGVYYALVSGPEAESTCTSKILVVN